MGLLQKQLENENTSHSPKLPPIPDSLAFQSLLEAASHSQDLEGSATDSHLIDVSMKCWQGIL